MSDNSCPHYHTHTEMIKKLEGKYDDLDDRVTALDKESAVSRTEILGVLKNLASIPETLTEVNKTMVSMQEEISKSGNQIGDLKGQMGNLKDDFKKLDTRITQVDEDGKFNIRKWFKDNWPFLMVGLLALVYIGSELVKGLGK